MSDPRTLGGPSRHNMLKKRGLRKKSLWERFRLVFLRLWWWWTGNLLNTQLEKEGSETRTEAQVALDRVVFETRLPPDCISAMIVRGGPCIYVKHDGPHEAFIANTYKEAADKAIEWINTQGDEISTKNTTKMSRKEQKVFDAQRRKVAAAVKAEKIKRGGLN